MRGLLLRDISVRTRIFHEEQVKMAEEWEELYNYMKRKDLSDKTIGEYLYWYLKYLEHFGSDPVSQVTIDKFLNRWNNMVARASMRLYLEFLHKYDIRIMRKTGRTAKRKVKTMSEDEMELVRAFLYDEGYGIYHDKRWGLMFDLTYTCGLRRHETINIRTEDFEWEKWGGDETKPCRLRIIGKGNKERFVIVPPALAQEVLKFASKHLKNERLFNVKARTWYDAFRHACIKTLNGKTYKLHEIRHTRTTDWYNEGVDIVRLKTRLGHADISTTQRYINPDEEKELENWEKEY